MVTWKQIEAFARSAAEELAEGPWTMFDHVHAQAQRVVGHWWTRHVGSTKPKEIPRYPRSEDDREMLQIAALVYSVVDDDYDTTTYGKLSPYREFILTALSWLEEAVAEHAWRIIESRPPPRKQDWTTR